MFLSWEPLGRAFNPLDHELPSGCSEYAQAPQALVLDDRIRVFFSMRERDTSTTFLSHVGYVDLSLDWKSVLDVAKHELIQLGSLGAFDEHGIFPMNVFHYSGRVFGFTTGWSRRISVPSDSSIGLVVSDDNGVTFRRIGHGPILASTINEPFLIADGCALSHDDQIHLWYIFGQRWKYSNDSMKAERVYKIGHAVSSDLQNWDRSGQPILADVLGEDECQALPTVFTMNGKFHMIFCFRAFEGFRKGGEGAYRLGYATSDDMITWTRDDAAGGLDFEYEHWDDGMRCYPNVVVVQDQHYLLYNGNEFGRYGFGVARLNSEG